MTARRAIEGVIDRRLLVNYRVDPEVVQRLLPAPFRPQLVNGYSVAGICLLRMTHLRPRGLPAWIGLRSENAAHRIAVEWDGDDGLMSGVYIPRRDSGSLTNVVVGGRVYPGEHHRARFDASDSDERVGVRFTSTDGRVSVEVDAAVTDQLGGSELFADVAEASSFFERGSVGYSATKEPGRFDGLQLATNAWSVQPANPLTVHSSFFEDTDQFPRGTATLDCTLLMRHVPVTWTPLPSLRGGASQNIR